MKVYGFEHHRLYNPWANAPAWAVEIGVLLALNLEQGQKTMAAIDDLKTAMGALIAEATADISGLLAQIAAQSNQDPAIVALTAQVTQATSDLHAKFTAATGVVPAPAPAPAPDAPAVSGAGAAGATS